MADVAAAPNEDEETRRIREEEEELDRLMLQQEQEQEQLLREEQEAANANHDPNDQQQEQQQEDEQHQQHLQDGIDNENDQFHDEQHDIDNDVHHHHPQEQQQARPRKGIPYTTGSFGAALGLIWYALRTRQQYYLAMVFLTSSKWAYIVLGNAIIASCVAMFRATIGFFLKGLRPIEAEGLGDFFRWNVTETCLALTMFRSEMNVKTGILFLILVWCKCVHWCAETRRSHLNMTEEAVDIIQGGWFHGWPTLPRSFVGFMTLLHLLIVVDIVAIAQCTQDIFDNGPSVAMFFGFEYSILFVTAMSNILLAHLHFVDGMIHWAHEHSNPQSVWHRFAHRSLHVWKDHKATLNFAVEVQAQAARFLFYIIFFGIVLTYYGMPINLFREVYMSFQSLKTRLTAFAKYRRLMRSMNRFDSVESEEELDEAGRICIICRDAMTLVDCKKLPGCGHVFHKSCLREWLVQQQTCPTCRSDIQASQARLRNAAQAAEAAEEAAGVAALEEEIEGQVPPDQPPALPDDGDNEAPMNPPDDTNVNDNNGTETNDGVARAPQTQTNENVSPTTNAAAVSSTSGGRRIQQTTRTTKKIPDASVFPCLYRVRDTEGVAVWSSKEDNKNNMYDDGDESDHIQRIIPCNTLVLCTKLEWKQFGESYSGMMLEIPNNGWIREDCLDRLVLDLPLRKQIKQ